MKTETIIKVPFYDVDMMNIVWHGNYFKYFELARCQLLDLIDYNYLAMKQSGYLWPITETAVRYIQPIKFEQQIKIIASLEEWENRIKINYQIVDQLTQQKLTKGFTIQLAIDQKTKQLCFQSPDVLLQKVAARLKGNK